MRLGEGAQWEIAKELHVDIFTSASSIIKGDETVPQGIRYYDLPGYDASLQNSESIMRVSQTITPYVASSWRWRTLWLRVMIEETIRKSKGMPTAESDRYFEELISIYHAEHADSCVYPPTGRFIAGLIRNAVHKR